MRQELAHVASLYHELKKAIREKEKCIWIFVAGEYRRIEIQNILYCEADDSYCRIYCTNGDLFLQSKTLKVISKMINDNSFIRPHQSFLLNTKFVESFSKSGNSIRIMSGINIPVSRSNRERVFNFLMNL